MWSASSRRGSTGGEMDVLRSRTATCLPLALLVRLAGTGGTLNWSRDEGPSSSLRTPSSSSCLAVRLPEEALDEVDALGANLGRKLEMENWRGEAG